MLSVTGDEHCDAGTVLCVVVCSSGCVCVTNTTSLSSSESLKVSTAAKASSSLSFTRSGAVAVSFCSSSCLFRLCGLLSVCAELVAALVDKADKSVWLGVEEGGVLKTLSLRLSALFIDLRCTF